MTERQRVTAEGPTLSPKVLITGTGRAGTTLLVQVLTDLGLDTGFGPDSVIDERAQAGLELPAGDPASPRIVKSPNLTRRMGELISEGRLNVEHVIIPIRDLDVATASRVRLTRYGSDLHTWGGLIGTTRATKQRTALAERQYELMYTIAKYNLPHTLLLFPKFARDWQYTFDQLSFLDPEIPSESWRACLMNRVRPDLIHESPLSSKERLLTVGGTAYNRGVLRPLRALRNLTVRTHGDPTERKD